ncbi:hypothetical protein UMC2_34031 [[Clostridium] sordellii]|uniref:coiled-coil domain-containing protein n=1 Tax=Paraclostridium sordellii TaxID=1505 RepID=UPI000543C558|nr:hypothetical protein [Paeniclostridium sordellii]CEK36533.1 hypothetical protein UMC2_34031 [[Clostridium] sordellii] [Paeniclostridium sordellii]
MLENIIDKVQYFMKKIEIKIKNNKSFPYMFILFFTIIGYMFFFNSNSIIKSEAKVELTTPLNETMELGNTKIKMLSRKYCKNSNMVEFYIYAKSIDAINTIKLNFEIKEQQNVSKIIKPEVRRLDENNYIVRAKIPKNWTVLSLTVSEFLQDDVLLDNEKNQQNISQTSIVKFYVENEDVEKVHSLKEKKASEYLVEGIDLEIKNIKDSITEKEKEINTKGIKIEELKETIVKLEEDKVYQTDIEKKDTDTTINAINSKIETLQSDIQKLHEQIKELNERIKKSEDKKAKLK